MDDHSSRFKFNPASGESERRKNLVEVEPEPDKPTGTRVLLVEDEESHAELIQESFSVQPDRFDLRTVETLSQALQAIEEFSPEMIICDLVLPDGQATELMAETGTQHRVPIVVMSSQGDEQIAVKAIKLGAMNYIVKSVSTMASLPRIVEKALREWRAQKTVRLATCPPEPSNSCAGPRLSELENSLKSLRGALRDEQQKSRQQESLLEMTGKTLETSYLAAFWVSSDGAILYRTRTAEPCLMIHAPNHPITEVFEVSPEFDPETWPALWSRLRTSDSQRITQSLSSFGNLKAKVEAEISMIRFEGQRVACIAVQLPRPDAHSWSLTMRRGAEEASSPDSKASADQRISAQIQNNLDAVITPMLRTLMMRTPENERFTIEELERQLRKITDPFTNRLQSTYAMLSPQEIRICNMIRNGASSKDVAEALGISVFTVHDQRRRIRRKLGISGKKSNLTSYLQTF